jgi:hypothetical protein
MPEFFRRELPETSFDQSSFTGIQGLRGIVLNPQSLSGGSVEVDARGAMALGQGGARFGQGVASVGGDLMQLAEEQARAVAIRQETDAENEMADAEGKIQIAMTQEQDETKWAGIAAEHLGNFEQNLFGREMTAAARDAVRVKVAGWKNRVGHFVGMASARRSVERAREGIAAKATRMMQAGDYGGVDALLRQPGTAKFMGEDWVARQESATIEHAQAKQRESRANDAVTIARTQGKAAAIEYVHSSEADPVEKERLMAEVDSIHRDEVGKAGDEFEEAVYSGALKVPGEVDAWKKDDPRITSKMREQFKAYIARKNDATAKANIEARAPELSSKLLSDVKQLDPNTATDEDFNALRLQIAELPEGYREIPYARLMQKFRQTDDAKQPGKDVLEVVENELHSYLEQGLFSGGDDPALLPVPLDAADVYTAEELKAMTPEQRAAAKGNVAAIEAENKKIQARIDANAKNRKAEIGGEVRRWLDAHPDATRRKVLKHMREKLPESTRAAMFDAFDDSGPAQAEIDAANRQNNGEPVGKGAGKSADAGAPSPVEANDPPLPTASGGVDNILLPAGLVPPHNPYGTMATAWRTVTDADKKAKTVSAYNKITGAWEQVKGSDLNPGIHLLPK